MLPANVRAIRCAILIPNAEANRTACGRSAEFAMSLAPSDASLEPPAEPRRLGQFDNRELSTIAMLAALHFGVSFGARMLGTVWYAFLGPFSIYVDGILSEGLRCLMLAVAVTLVPRVGTAGLTIAVVAILNAIVSGTFAVASLVQAGVSIVVFELVLGTLGVTLESSLRRPAARLANSLVWRTALAVGIANGMKLYAQYFVSMWLYRFHFDMWFVHSAALAAGFLYGSIGAAVGTVWGFSLRRTAP
jgi:hypothetical protein